jgi:peptidoglycan hydrolase-like protein with peptidoglycan-binding domain
MTVQRPPILQRGATGAFVERLQGDLSRLGYDIATDGVFSESTENAVKKFQQDHDLTVDGVVGPETGKHLGAPLS